MCPQYKLRFAHTLMVLGITPWVIAVIWSAAFLLTSSPGQPPVIPVMDPLSMIGLLITTFAIGVVVAGLSALWSFSLTARHAELRSRKVFLFRVAVAASLFAPQLLSALM